jgi:hypothetical protein
MATLAHIFFYPFFSIFYFLFTLTRSHRRELKAKQKQKGTLIIDATGLPASNFYLHYLNIYMSPIAVNLPLYVCVLIKCLLS